MAQSKPYYWMVDYTRQKQWLDGQGVWLWLAFVLGGLGCGLYLVSLYVQSWPGMLIGWFIGAVLKGGTHLMYLGRPWRAWRAFAHPQSSWVTRGIIFVLGFGLFGILQLAPGFIAGLPWTLDNAALRGIAAVFALLVMFYPGFTMSYVNAIPFWSNGLLPVLFATYGLLGGFGLSVPLAISGGGTANLAFLESGLRIMLLLGTVELVIYLSSGTYSGPAGKNSVYSMLKGESSLLFYLGVVLLGIVIPFVISAAAALAGHPSLGLVLLGTAAELTGSFALRYCLLKGGVYAPLVASNFSHKA